MKTKLFDHKSLFFIQNSNGGQALVMLLLYLMLAILITSASVTLILVNSRATDTAYQGATAYDVAESGAETAMIKLLRNPDYAGETVDMSGGQATITITGTNPKTIVSEGRIFNFTRKIEVIVDTSNNMITATSWKEI